LLPQATLIAQAQRHTTAQTWQAHTLLGLRGCGAQNRRCQRHTTQGTQPTAWATERGKQVVMHVGMMP
jgi:hypothetical protein